MRDLSWPMDPELTEEEAVSIAADLLNRFDLPFVIMDTNCIRERIRDVLDPDPDEELVELVKTSTEWNGQCAEYMEDEGNQMIDNAIFEYDHDRNH